MKVVKIQSRCFIKEAVGNIKSILREDELMWFTNHPQFKHLFHMHLEKRNKVQGMWMLFLHAVITEKKREAWFVINGVPIRYSLKEHGILSGLYCHNYPADYMSTLGGNQFMTKTFKAGSVICYEMVRDKFLSMRNKPSRGNARLQMAVLYFLSSVIRGNAKKADKKTQTGAPSVDQFFLQAVDDLDMCQWFPWGRYSFDQNLDEMQRLFKSFKDKVFVYDPKKPKNWAYPCFNIPLQVNE